MIIDQYKNQILNTYFKSYEWSHILNTALDIQRGLINLIEKKETLEIGDNILDVEFLENAICTNFEMPASVRVAVATVERMILEGYEPCDIIDHASDIYTEIVSYWMKDILENYMSYAEDAEISLNDDGSISLPDDLKHEECIHLINANLNGDEYSLVIQSFDSLSKPFIDICLITTFVNPISSDMKINDLLEYVYRLNKDNQIKTPNGDILTYTLQNVSADVSSQLNAVDAFGWIIDILSASENIDQFMHSELFLKFLNELPEHADIFLFALELYRDINLVDKSNVTFDHLYWYLNERKRTLNE